MTVGLLECDHVMEDLQPIGGDYPDMFRALLPDLEFECFDVRNGVFPQRADACGAYLCTGSRFSVYDQEDWILRLLAFIRELHDARIPFVGVCFGHQALGAALGGRVAPAPSGWSVGVHSFTLLERAPWMQPYSPSVNLLMMCQDQVLDLPAGARVLASAPACPVGMFQVGSTMLGIQAHPEFPVPYERALLEKRRERIGAPVEAAIRSLDLPLHSTVVADWIRSFIGG